MTINRSTIDIIASLEKLFEEHFGSKPERVDMLPVSGSDRSYYRLSNKKNSVIGTYNDNVNENNSYFYFTELFKKHEINVPEVYIKCKERKCYLQQDLGNVSLYDQLMEKGYTDEVKNNFQSALNELVKVQWLAGREVDFNQCFAAKKFDEKAIMADLLYFKYYFADLLKIQYDKTSLLDEMEQLSRELGRIQPQMLMYRDFQSRNIMLHEGKTFLIDFQGAMQGPTQYDIASLLWQAKAQLPKEWKEELLTGYITKLNELPAARMEELHFRKGYAQFVLLRLLQVLGAYGFRGLIEKKPHFVSSIAPALKNLERFLATNPQLPSYPELRKLLENISLPQMQAQFENPVQKSQQKLKIQINSFSYKNGIPEDKSSHSGGYVFDCRGLLNPGRYEEHKYFTGQNVSVQDFLKKQTRMAEFLEHVFALVSINVEDYLARDFEHLSISFGCTGGQHRSVYAAEQLAEYLKDKYHIPVSLKHLNEKKWKLKPEVEKVGKKK